MKFTIEDMFRNSFCITTSEENYRTFRQRMLCAGFSDEMMPKMFNGTHPKSIAKNCIPVQLCALSHYYIINMAKTLDFPWVTIFEDDALPMKNCKETLEQFILESELPDNADIIIWGNLEFIHQYQWYCNNNVVFNNHYALLRHKIWGSQSNTIFKKDYDTWLSAFHFFDDKELSPDWYHYLGENKYVSTRSFFLQWKNNQLQHENLMNLNDRIHINEFI